jgi:hypothetical protein
MKTRSLLCALGVLLGVLSRLARAEATDEAAAAKSAVAPAGGAPKTPALSPRFQEVRDRINALFQYRDSGLPPLEPGFNPFRSPAAPVVAPVGIEPAPEGTPQPAAAAASDLALLQASVAALKVSGIVEIGGKQHFVINSRPFKEGDVIQTHAQGVPVYLRVREIKQGRMVLALNEAETTLKWPKDGDPPR